MGRRTGKLAASFWEGLRAALARLETPSCLLPGAFRDWLSTSQTGGRFKSKKSPHAELFPDEDDQPDLAPWCVRAQSAAEDDPVIGLLLHALVCRAIVRHATGQSMASVGWRFPDAAPPVAWLDRLAEHLPTAPLDAFVAGVLDDCDGTSDPIRRFYEQLLPQSWRRQRGEVYTPFWLAERIVAALWEPGLTWVDPCVGGGAFGLALLRHAARLGCSTPDFVGIDANPWALLGAAASLAWEQAKTAGRPLQGFIAPLVCADLLHPRELPALPSFARVVGNPPWVLWDQLPGAVTTGARYLWARYGLLAESGMASILGGGKKDLAMLITYLAADRLLDDGGRLGFVITQSVLKSARSGRGFRRLRLPDGKPLGIVAVEDWSTRQLFGRVGAKAIVLLAQKGAETVFPVPYYVAQASSMTLHQAEPADPSDALSAWRHVNTESAAAVRAVLGTSAYRAHLGVNTGGANGIYLFERLTPGPDGLWTMRNRADRGLRNVPVHEVVLEADLLYPVLLGSDVRAWQAVPGAWVLLVQDPELRRGRSFAELEQQAPRSLAYLRRFCDLLTSRAAYRRYFQPTGRAGRARASAPFYSMFDVGTYTLAPVKVIWQRMGRRLAAAVVTQVEGKPILGQETHAFFPLEDLAEAHYLAALLNSRPAQLALEAIGQVGGKSFATPQTIHQLALRRFNPADSCHCALAELGERIHQQAAAGSTEPHSLEALDRLAETYWGIAAGALR